MSGTVIGEAQFDISQENELLYNEQGKLTLSSMDSLDESLNVSQKYLYIYDPNTDQINSYFVEKNTLRGSFFHQLRFEEKQTSTDQWIATGEHLCGQDHYCVFYSFHVNGTSLSQFQIKYVVKGPKKDYVSSTTFRSCP